MDNNDIPQDKKVNVPMGVSESTWETEKETNAFLAGLNEPFQQERTFVVRVKYWDDED